MEPCEWCSAHTKCAIHNINEPFYACAVPSCVYPAKKTNTLCIPHSMVSVVNSCIKCWDIPTYRSPADPTPLYCTAHKLTNSVPMSGKCVDCSEPGVFYSMRYYKPSHMRYCSTHKQHWMHSNPAKCAIPSCNELQQFKKINLCLMHIIQAGRKFNFADSSMQPNELAEVDFLLSLA